MSDKLINDELIKIVLIGDVVSIRGQGISLSEALKQASYKTLRNRFDYIDLTKVLSMNSRFIDIWYRYSEDKRTSGGYYLLNDTIGSIDKSIIYHNPNKTILVAKYIILELDHWCEKQVSND